MAPAAEAFRADLEAVSFQPATVPVYQNVTAAPTQDPTALRDQLLVQLSAPVQWTRSVAMGAAGLTATVECGPGAVLATMVRRIDKAITCHATGTQEALKPGMLWRQGYERGARRPRDRSQPRHRCSPSRKACG